MSARSFLLQVLALFALALPCAGVTAESQVTPAQARAIAKEAYIYGNPMVDNYRIQYAYFMNPQNSEYKGPFNKLVSVARVYTPQDRAIQTPNSDTPYSFVGMDLRTEPVVLTLPPMDQGRYFSLQFIDWYTHNFDYAGSRTTGNAGATLLVAGPGWQGRVPAGITKVVRSETQFIFVGYRTQLFGPEDLGKVRKIQEGFKAQPLSAFLGQPAPKAAPVIDWVKPLSVADQKSSLEFFNLLNFVLRFCPTVPSEQDLMARFAKIGIGAGKKLDVAKLSPEMKQALAGGIADAWQELDTLEKTDIATGKVTSGDMFGTRAYLDNNYLYRFAGAVIGIYGLSKDEAVYPVYRVDAKGESLDASKHQYTLRFAPGQLPPANAFWSVTLYDLPASLLVVNPLDRYLINSPMLPDLKQDADGGLTIYVQHKSPGKDKESNWLPAPNGPFWLAMRIYWPKPEVLDGTWKQPPLARAK